MTAPLTEKARTTRGALVDSASALFVEQGYSAVSVRDLARRTQVTSGALYGHFRNKADLLVAAIADHIARDLYLPSNGRAGFRNYMQRSRSGRPSTTTSTRARGSTPRSTWTPC